MLPVEAVNAKVEFLRRRNTERDTRMRNVSQVRSGDVRTILPGLFPDYWPQPVIANVLDTVMRDLSEQIGKMPSLICSAGQSVTQKAQKNALKRQYIAMHYAEISQLRVRLTEAADWYCFYGFLPIFIEPDFDMESPRVRFENPQNCHYESDVMGKVTSFAKVYMEKAGDLAAKYPEYAAAILGSPDPRSQARNSDSVLTLVRYCDKDQYLMYIPERTNLVIGQMPNPLGEVPVEVAVRPKFDEQTRGQMDDVMWVQLAKARLSLLNMEAVEKSVQGPLAIPKDVRKWSEGPDAVIQTDFPEKIRKVGIELPPTTVQQLEMFTGDLMIGARYPGTRSGKAPGSIVTGQGVEALEGGFDSQVKNAQEIIGFALKRALMKCFKLDEKIWKNKDKTLRAYVNGSPFEDHYQAKKDIDGNHQLEVVYGFASGMDPSRALVFLLQLAGVGAVDRAFILDNMPFDINHQQMLQRVDIEKLEGAVHQGLMAMAAATGEMMSSGQDPTDIITKIGKVLEAREKGMSMTDAFQKGFAQPKQQQPPPGMDQGQGQDQMAGAMGGGPGGPGGPMGMMQAMQGGNPLQPQAAPGQQAPGGRPQLQQLLAALKGNGQPQMQASIGQRSPTGLAQ